MANRYYSGPKSDHFDGKRFFNPDGIPPSSLGDVLNWQTGGGKQNWPAAYPSPYADKPPARVTGADMRVSFIGHATVLVQTAGLNILTDPVWSKRASPVPFAGPKRVNDPGIALVDLPPIDVILLSHNHYDHMDMKTLVALQKRDDPLIVTPLGNDTILYKKNKDFRIVVGDWGDTVTVAPDITVSFEPAHHWSARTAGDRCFALWAAFVLTTPHGRIYHIGDTGFHNGVNFNAAREKYGSFRLAIIPFGAYEPRWFMKGQHQNPDEAVRCHQMCNAAYTVGHHWGTFQLTNESIEDPLHALDQARQKYGVEPDRFRALRPGQVWDIPVVLEGEQRA